MTAHGPNGGLIHSSPSNPKQTAYNAIALLLDIKAEQNNVTIFDDIILTFFTAFTRFFRALLTFELNVIVITNHDRSNKAFFEISMNFTSGLRRGGTYRNSPSANFFDPCSEVSLQVKY